MPPACHPQFGRRAESHQVHIVAGPSDTGARLGGRAPAAVVPLERDALTRYFVTLPVFGVAGKEVSIFLSFDHSRMAEAAARIGVPGLVEAVVHDASRRGGGGDLDSMLSEHPLVIEPVARSDAFVNPDGEVVVRSSHKVGGSPFILNREDDLLAAVEAKFEEGFVQYLQLEFPGGLGDANVSGSWPFGDGIFHLFAKPPLATAEWTWFWEY